MWTVWHRAGQSSTSWWSRKWGVLTKSMSLQLLKWFALIKIIAYLIGNISGLCQYLSYFTPTPLLTCYQLTVVRLGEGGVRSVSDTDNDPNKYQKVVIFQGVILEFILLRYYRKWNGNWANSVPYVSEEPQTCSVVSLTLPKFLFFVLSVLYFYTPWDKFDVISAFFWYRKHVTKDKIAHVLMCL